MATGQRKTGADPGELRGLEHRLPAIVADRADKQRLDRLPGIEDAEQPRRENPGVVEHQDVAGLQILGDVQERAVLDPAAGPIHDQEAGRVPFGSRLLRDQVRRKIVIEMAEEHWYESLDLRAERRDLWTKRRSTICESQGAMRHLGHPAIVARG
jgi:hypothetical protein